MRKTVVRFGFMGVVLMFVILTIEFLIFRKKYNFDVQEIIGYITIILSLSFVYFGIRHWRDNYNSGSLSFGEGFKLGLLITLFPSLAFGLLSLFEIGVLDPEFNDKYYAHAVQKLKASTPPDELPQELQKLDSQKEMFSSPFVQFGAMCLTVFLIGIVITVIATLILQKSKNKTTGR